MTLMRVAGAGARTVDADVAPLRIGTDSPARGRSRADTIHLFRRVATDLFAAAAAGALSVALVPVPGALVAIAAVVGVLGLRLGNLYEHGVPPSVLDHGMTIVATTAVSSFAAAALTGTGARAAAVHAGTLAVMVVLGRAAVYRVERSALVAQPRRVLIVGAGAAGQAFADRLLRHPEHGMVPLGFIDDAPDPIDPDLPIGVVGGFADLLPVMSRLRVERIIVDGGAVREDDLLDLLDCAARSNAEIAVLPSLAQHLSTAITVEGLAGMTLLSYRQSQRTGISWTGKRLLDVVVAAVTLVLTAPLWLAAALVIKLDSPGPVLFRQRRIGRNGQEFDLYKLRTMRRDAEAARAALLHLNEADGPYFKIASDPRITRVGRFLRRYSIDELPQLVNVLRGDMSLVGPRPPLAEEVQRYPGWFRRRLSVPPGLTGLWQVSGRFLLPFEEAARLDVFYVDHWSLGLDIKILLRTPVVVASGRGAR